MTDIKMWYYPGGRSPEANAPCAKLAWDSRTERKEGRNGGRKTERKKEKKRKRERKWWIRLMPQFRKTVVDIRFTLESFLVLSLQTFLCISSQIYFLFGANFQPVCVCVCIMAIWQSGFSKQKCKQALCPWISAFPRFASVLPNVHLHRGPWTWEAAVRGKDLPRTALLHCLVTASQPTCWAKLIAGEWCDRQLVFLWKLTPSKP